MASRDEIEIKYTANIRDVERGAEKMSDALGQTEDALDDVGRAGEKAGRDAADGLEKIEPAAEKGKEGISGIGDVARDVLSGDLTSAAESGAQALEGLGPVGLAAGTAAAAGIALLQGALQEGQEDTERFQQRVRELTDQLIDSGAIGRRSYSDIADDLRDLATNADDGGVNLEKLEEYARRLKIPLDEITASYLAGGSALQDQIDRTQELIDKEEERLLAESKKNDPEGRGAGTSPALRELEDQRAKLEEQRDAIEKAQEAQLRYLRSGASEFEVKKAQIDKINDAYDDAAASVEDFQNKETGVIDFKSYVEALERKQEALRDYQLTLDRSGLSDEAKAFIVSQGAERGALLIQGYESQAPDIQARLAAAWTEAGKQNSAEYVNTFLEQNNAFLKGYKPPPIVFSADTTPAEKELKELQAKYAYIGVNIVAKSIDKALKTGAFDG